MRTLFRGICHTSTALDRVASVLAGVAIVVLVGAVMLQVVARYMFSQPPAYTEELARYAMIWAGLIGGFLLRHSRTMADALPFSTVWVAVAVPLMIVLILIHLVARWCGDTGPAEPERDQS